MSNPSAMNNYKVHPEDGVIDSRKSSVQSEVSTTTIDSDDEDTECTLCCGMCCVKGCLLGVLAAVFFFIFLPAGILLLYNGITNNRTVTLAIGSAILTLPIVVGCPIFLYFRWRRFKIKDRKQLVRARKKGFENPMVDSIPDEDL